MSCTGQLVLVTNIYCSCPNYASGCSQTSGLGLKGMGVPVLTTVVTAFLELDGVGQRVRPLGGRLWVASGRSPRTWSWRGPTGVGPEERACSQLPRVSAAHGLPPFLQAEAAVAAVAVADTVRDGAPAVGPDSASTTWGRGRACTAALLTPAPGTLAGGSTGPSAAASFFIRYGLPGLHAGPGLAWGQLGWERWGGRDLGSRLQWPLGLLRENHGLTTAVWSGSRVFGATAVGQFPADRLAGLPGHYTDGRVHWRPLVPGLGCSQGQGSKQFLPLLSCATLGKSHNLLLP